MGKGSPAIQPGCPAVAIAMPLTDLPLLLWASLRVIVFLNGSHPTEDLLFPTGDLAGRIFPD